VNYRSELQRLHESYGSQIRDLNLELLTTKADLAQKELRHNRRSDGFFSTIGCRKKKDLADLAKNGGLVKRVKAAIR
jgi:hypothetical protein